MRKNFQFQKLVFGLFFLMICNYSLAQNPIITKWNTNVNNDNSASINIYSIGNFNYTYVGVTNSAIVGSGTGNNELTTISFPQPGIYSVSIMPTSTFKFNFGIDNGIYAENNRKFIEIIQWGNVNWNPDLSTSFVFCENLKITAADIPNFSNVTNMGGMFGMCSSLDTVPNMNNWNTSNVIAMHQLFYGATIFNENIGAWNTSNVVNMYEMFVGATEFNQNIGNWNTSNVKFMTAMFVSASNFNQNIGAWDTSEVLSTGSMFSGATNFNQNIGAWDTSKVVNMSGMFSYTNFFNQNIGSWDTSSVTDMAGMFYNTYSFNQEIGNWNTSNVTNMSSMFEDAIAFNQDISDWDTSNVTDMSWMLSAYYFNQDIGNWDTSSVTNMWGMFYFAKNFNQDIESWNTENVTDMGLMFYEAEDFNQRLGGWNLSSVESMGGMFDNTNMSCINYSLTLKGWAENTNTPNGIGFSASGINYGNLGQIYRDQLITTKQWSINSDIYDASCIVLDVQNPIITTWNTNINNDNSNQISVATTGDYNYSYINTTNPAVTGSGKGIIGNKTIVFPDSGIYNVSIYPLTSFSFNNYVLEQSNKNKLVNITQWGNDVIWNSSLSAMFFSCQNLKIMATDIPNFANVTDVSGMFYGCSSLETIPNISSWNISGITNLALMFSQASSFNQDLGALNFNNSANLTAFFESSGMSCLNYGRTLMGWSNNAMTPIGLALGSYGLQYGNQGQIHRNSLITNKGWSITGDSLNTNCADASLGSVENQLWVSDVIIFPNPANNIINISAKKQIINQVSVYDIAGRLLKTENPNSTITTIDVRNLPNAIYFIEVKTSLGSTTERIVKK